MENKNIIKKISIIILILVIGLATSNHSYAIGSVFSDADNFLSKGDPVSSTISESQLKETSSFIFKLLTSIGIVVMFLIGTIIGIQFMVASAEDKAKVKEALIPYVVGCGVIFGAFTIWGTTVRLGQTIAPSGAGSGTVIINPSTNGKLYQVTTKRCNICGIDINEIDHRAAYGNTHDQAINEITTWRCETCGQVATSVDITRGVCSRCNRIPYIVEVEKLWCRVCSSYVVDAKHNNGAHEAYTYMKTIWKCNKCGKEATEEEREQGFCNICSEE